MDAPSIQKCLCEEAGKADEAIFITKKYLALKFRKFIYGLFDNGYNRKAASLSKQTTSQFMLKTCSFDFSLTESAILCNI